MYLSFYVSSKVSFNEGREWRCNDGHKRNLFVQDDSLPVYFMLEYSVIYYSLDMAECKRLRMPA